MCYSAARTSLMYRINSKMFRYLIVQLAFMTHRRHNSTRSMASDAKRCISAGRMNDGEPPALPLFPSFVLLLLLRFSNVSGFAKCSPAESLKRLLASRSSQVRFFPLKQGSPAQKQILRHSAATGDTAVAAIARYRPGTLRRPSAAATPSPYYVPRNGHCGDESKPGVFFRLPLLLRQMPQKYQRVFLSPITPNDFLYT